MKPLLFTLCLIIPLSGCTTFTSTLLHRGDDETLSKNSHHAFKGVPTAVMVPSHLDVWVEEEYFMVNSPDGFKEVSIPGAQKISLRTADVKTKKIFVIDFKRPAAGSLAYDLGFNSNQYLNKFANEIVDESIKDITNLVVTASTTFARPTGAGIPQSLEGQIWTAKRDIAYQRFDLDSPTFEDDLNSFVGQYTTDCHDCMTHVELDFAAHNPQRLPAAQ